MMLPKAARPLVMALMALMTLWTGSALAGEEQLVPELVDYATAGSEDIYFQSNSGLDGQWEDYEDYPEDAEDEEDEEAEDSVEEQPQGDNIEAIGLDENSCEYSCPRYYRPVCVRRNDQLITYATPCEYFNQVRCANVARSQGKEVPSYQLLYQNACKNKRS